MRISPIVFASCVVLVGLEIGCGSSSSSNDGGGGHGGSGGMGGRAMEQDGGGAGTGGGAGDHDGGADASARADAGAKGCLPGCGTDSICVATGTEGGAHVIASDAGVCPTGRHLVGVDTCTPDLTYACVTIPSGCGGTVTCACAPSLCQASHTCRGPTEGVLTCVEQVP